MRIALDEGVPENLADYLLPHQVESVRMLGLKGVKNGKLLALLTEMAFNVFITNDKRMEAEGQLVRRPFAIPILSATNWPVVKPHVGNIAAALNLCSPGSILKVDCGTFLAKSR